MCPKFAIFQVFSSFNQIHTSVLFVSRTNAYFQDHSASSSHFTYQPPYLHTFPNQSIVEMIFIALLLVLSWWEHFICRLWEWFNGCLGFFICLNAEKGQWIGILMTKLWGAFWFDEDYVKIQQMIISLRHCTFSK